MDGIGSMTCIQGKHLRSPTRRSKKDEFLLQAYQSPYDGSRKGGLTRTRTTTENHHRMLLTIQHEIRKHVEGVFLLRRRHQSEGLQNPIFQFIPNHYGCKDMNFFLILNS